MVDWLSNLWAAMTLREIFLGVGLFLISLTVSFAAIVVVMVKIPHDYFKSDYCREFLPGRPWYIRYSAVIAKNLLGVFLVVLGIILSLPGVPGQGILTILLGLIMLDIPGKRPLEAKIIQRPTVLAAINRLRAKYGKPPLEVD